MAGSLQNLESPVHHPEMKAKRDSLLNHQKQFGLENGVDNDVIVLFKRHNLSIASLNRKLDFFTHLSFRTEITTIFCFILIIYKYDTSVDLLNNSLPILQRATCMIASSLV